MFVPAIVSGQTTTPGAGTSTTGGTTINVFCLDFGKKFPDGQSIKAQGLADDKVRSALNYALSKGYVQSNPYEVQLAVWNISDGQPFHDVNNRGTTIAQEIVSNAGTTAPTGSASDVTNITVSNLKAADANAAYGTGTVTGSLPTNVPVGFVLPASDGTFQRLVSVVASTTGQAGTAGTSTTGTTVAGSATTGTGTTAAGTTTSGTTAAGTTVAQAATATTASTASATATVAATATTAATSTLATTATRSASAPAATGVGGAVSTTAPATLPTTGTPHDGSSNWGGLLALLAMLGAVTAGFVLRRRSTHLS
jgi:hypothetical protein